MMPASFCFGEPKPICYQKVFGFGSLKKKRVKAVSSRLKRPINKIEIDFIVLSLHDGC
jgi:hypothetical protein